MGFFRSLEEIKAYTYGIHSPAGVEDQFVSEALKDFDMDLYESLGEYTKRGATAYEVEEIFYEVQGGNQNRTIEIDSSTMGVLNYAMKRVRQRLPKAVEPWSVEETIAGLHKDTSAGYGYPGKKKGDVLDKIESKVRDVMLKAKMGVPQVPEPTLLGTRGHMHINTSRNRRVIYNVPASQITLEQMFVSPIMVAVKKEKNGLIFTGQDVLPRLRDLSAKCFPRGSSVVRTDFDKFDRNTVTALLDMALDIIEDMIDFTTWKGKKLRASEQKRYRRVWEYVRLYFIHTPIMLPNGKLEWLDGTIISGSGLTQLVGSIITAILIESVAYHEGNGIYELHTLGDDGFVALARRPNLDMWEQKFQEWFGAVLSKKKTQVFDGKRPDKQFLGYKFKGGMLVRDSFDWFNLALHPEREVDTVEKSFSRLIAYMHLGAVNDVKFSKFFEHYQSGYAISNVDLIMDYDMKAKMMYGGMNFEKKGLFNYTRADFVFGVLTYKYN